jgi:hypothetical protein
MPENKDSNEHDCKGGLVICKIPGESSWYLARLTGEWNAGKMLNRVY